MTEKHIPKHVAIIPDGNRRWAKEKGMKSWIGHEYGAKNTELIVRHALKLGVRCLSFWGSSLENLKKRPFQEKKALLSIYEKYFTNLVSSKDIHENKVRINFIGRWEQQFPEKLKKVLRECVEKTKNYKNYALNFFLAYNGDDEMIQAVQNIINSRKKGEKITANILKENLMTRDIPAVDLLIRTGGEPHLSAGFMMWDIANSQMFFSKKYYPDFKNNNFEEALEEYSKRERRLGK
jgi:undecaprenyl diphosphate synthase